MAWGRGCGVTTGVQLEFLEIKNKNRLFINKVWVSGDKLYVKNDLNKRKIYLMLGAVETEFF